MEPLGEADPRWVGRYEVLGRIGAGGMGRVYLARSASGRRMAVKVIHRDLVGSPEFRARFAREIAAVRAVGGFYTAAVVDADADAEQPWLATEYVPGPSLDEAVRDRGPVSGEALRLLAVGLAEALSAIHAAGVVHRDFKPSNVLLAADGPRVIDFGIARAFDATALTSAQHVIGTPGFMAPEQLRDGVVTAAADVFCLGLTLAYAATGRPPFGTGSWIEVSFRVVGTEPDLDGVPPALLTIIEHCLAKEPEQRPGIAEVLAALAGGDADQTSASPIASETPASFADPQTPPHPQAPATQPAFVLPPPPPAPDRSGGGRRAVPGVVASVAALALALGLAWYLNSGGDNHSAGSGPQTQTSTTPASSPPASPSPTPSPSAGPVVVGSLAFPESTLLGEIYAQALAAKHFTVMRSFNIGSRQTAFSQARSGALAVLPEYNGALLSFVDSRATTQQSPAAVDAALAAKLPEGLRVLRSSPAEDKDALVVTAATAAQYHLKSVADLAPVAGKLAIGASSSFETGLAPFLQSGYGVRFKDFKVTDIEGELSLNALRNGDVQVTELATTDPAIAADNLVVLSDEKYVFGTDNVIPLVADAKLPAGAADALNAVSAKLTTADLQQLLKQVVTDKKDPAQAAQGWLAAAGLV